MSDSGVTATEVWLTARARRVQHRPMTRTIPLNDPAELVAEIVTLEAQVRALDKERRELRRENRDLRGQLPPIGLTSP